MNGFKKLILTTAILAVSSSAMAMEAMDEASLSATTGQDGLTITLDTNLSGLGITYVDRDGVVGDATYANSGAVVISPVGVTTTGLRVDIDAGGDAGDTTGVGMLQIKLTAPNATVIDLNGTKISVADADATGSAVGATTDIITFAPGANLTIDGSATPLMNIQLGNESQGAMIKVVADIANASLTGLTINDAGGAASGGSIRIDTITLGTVHAVNSIDVTAAGLVIDTTGTTIGEVGLEGVRLGATATIGTAARVGDIYLTGLNPTGTITVAGH